MMFTACCVRFDHGAFCLFFFQAQLVSPTIQNTTTTVCFIVVTHEQRTRLEFC